MPDAFLTARRITLRVLDQSLPPGPDTLDRLAPAIDSLNAARRYPGLPDELNPELLDPAKVHAFLARLPAQDARALAALEGRTLYLNAPDLGLGLASPYAPADLAAGYELAVPAVPPGKLVLPALRASVNLADVTARAGDAAQAVREFDWQVAEWERSLRESDPARDPDAHRALFAQLGDTKFRRSQAAVVRRDLLRAAARQDPTLADAATGAQQDAARFVVPPRHT